MATFVIVHGGWGGGWEWTPVARLLRSRGHEVFTPTLTGLGEREHLGTDVGLKDHIRDVEAVIAFEGLDDIILCGHSYSGMVVTGVADSLAERVRLLVYLDSFVPEDGQSLVSLTPNEFADELDSQARERGDGRVPIPDELLPDEDNIETAERNAYIARLRPQSIRTMTEPLALTGLVDRLNKAYVRCTADSGPPIMEPFADRARKLGWVYREIETAHDMQLTDPTGTARILDELAG